MIDNSCNSLIIIMSIFIIIFATYHPMEF